MSDRSDLEQARQEMLAVLDIKFANIPEWRAFRAIDRVLAAMGNDRSSTITAAPKPIRRTRSPRSDSYVELGLRAISEARMPLRTEQMLDYIGKHRELSGETKKIKINVQSSFSKDPRFQSITWEGGRAWWFSDKPVPANPAGGSLALETLTATD